MLRLIGYAKLAVDVNVSVNGRQCVDEVVEVVNGTNKHLTLAVLSHPVVNCQHLDNVFQTTTYFWSRNLSGFL